MARVAASWLLTLSLPALLCLASARLLLSHAFLRIEYQRPGFPVDVYGFTTDDRLQYGGLAIDYLFEGAESESLSELRLPGALCFPADRDDCAMFSALELRHMRDVKAILRLAFGAALACGFVNFCMAIYGWRRWRRALILGLRRGCMLTWALIAALGTLAAASWNSAFDGFHALFFAAETWRFPFSATLIRLYPERLFVDAAIAIGVMMGMAALVILIWLGRFGMTEAR